MNKYTRLFIDETREYIVAINKELARFRSSANKSDGLADSSRLAHSIKGMASFEEQPPIVSLAYALQKGLESLSEDGAQHHIIINHLEKGLKILSKLVDEVDINGKAATDPETIISAIRNYLER